MLVGCCFVECCNRSSFGLKLDKGKLWKVIELKYLYFFLWTMDFGEEIDIILVNLTQ